MDPKIGIIGRADYGVNTLSAAVRIAMKEQNQVHIVDASFSDENIDAAIEAMRRVPERCVVKPRAIGLTTTIEEMIGNDKSFTITNPYRNLPECFIPNNLSYPRKKRGKNVTLKKKKRKK